MKVFISWSGDRSKAIAGAFKEWLPSVIQAVRPYFSPNDIEKGARWSNEISKELESSAVGLICLTKENLTASWLMFEAGALSKSLDESRVCPMLFGLEPSDMSGPLVQFQATSFSKEEVLKLLRTINQQLDSAALESKTLEAVFEKWWPDLEQKVAAVLKGAPAAKDVNLRSEREILEEVLQLSRVIHGRTRNATVHEGVTGSRPSINRATMAVVNAFLEYGNHLASHATEAEQITEFLVLAMPLADLLTTVQGETVRRSISLNIANVIHLLQKRGDELQDEIPF